MLALRTYFDSYSGTNKVRSTSGRPTMRDAQHSESGVLNNYDYFTTSGWKLH